MFFALLALRPATAPLEPGPRLELWSRVLEQFFFWVIAAIVLLLASGYGMIFGVYGGVCGLGPPHPPIEGGGGLLKWERKPLEPPHPFISYVRFFFLKKKKK